MRYADHAYAHAQANEKDTNRAPTLDRRASDAGFKNTADYIDNVMGRPDTKSYEAANNRVGWMNANERLYGWNNRNNPSQSTVIPKGNAQKTIREFENHKENEAGKMGVAKEAVKERGPIPEHRRDVAQDQKTEQARAVLRQSFDNARQRENEKGGIER